MNAARCKLLVCVVTASVSLLTPGSVSGVQAVANRELLRNGGFELGKTAWALSNLTHVGGDYGNSGAGMQIWPDALAQDQGYVYQELYLPARVDRASVSVDYRFRPQYGATFGQFRVRVVTTDSDLAAALNVTVYPGEAWQQAQYTLSPGELTAVNEAHASGRQVWLVIDLWARFLYVDVDNVSLRVDGESDLPALIGSIACVGLDESGRARTVMRIEPDGSSYESVWTHPDTTDPHIYDVAWKPDAGELSFSSDHEFAHSAFHSDIYGVGPDGSELRRITNPPSRSDLEGGEYSLGTVSGRITNNYGTVNPFLVYVQGALQVMPVDVGGYGSEVGFTVPGVADLGTGVDQYIVFAWSDLDSDCANGKEFAVAPAVDVVGGGSIDVGTLTFQGQCHHYNVQSISWKRDGSEVGFFLESIPRKVAAQGGVLGSELFDIGTVLASGLAWSPAQANQSQILYVRKTFDANGGVYLTSEDGGVGDFKVSDSHNNGRAIFTTPAWLPDGSGFVYTLDQSINGYDLAAGQVAPLAIFNNEYVTNPSLSPDGKYVVFERQSVDTVPIRYDLWVMNIDKPVEMWPLTTDGRSGNPDWSRVDPPTLPSPQATASSTPTPTPTSVLPPSPSAVPSPTRTPGTGHCVGDCSGDGSVTIEELIRGVNIALGTQELSACPAYDANADGSATVDELVKAVNAALSGCAL